MQLIFENCGILDENPAPNKYEYEKHKSIGPSFSMGKRFDLPESEYCLEISKINPLKLMYLYWYINLQWSALYTLSFNMYMYSNVLRTKGTFSGLDKFLLNNLNMVDWNCF